MAAPSKINLSLVVGQTVAGGLHELATVMQRVDIADRLSVERASSLEVRGFPDDTLVTRALESLASAARPGHSFRVSIDKRIPAAAGLGGGSADAAAALTIANRLLAASVSPSRLHQLAATIGSDVPFFLDAGPKLVEGTGERLRSIDLPQDYFVVIALPHDVEKRSTGAVYRTFDQLGGGGAFVSRRGQLVDALAVCGRARDLARLPGNDLAQASGASTHASRLSELGAFRADVSGAGPSVYGLFTNRSAAERAREAMDRHHAETWLTVPVW
ncbi:MAG: 4-(cytidine 5'-diphospho)-2-C-methyl-D-erythritol kinase [Gaiellales bacterium]